MVMFYRVGDKILCWRFRYIFQLKGYGMCKNGQIGYKISIFTSLPFVTSTDSTNFCLILQSQSESLRSYADKTTTCRNNSAASVVLSWTHFYVNLVSTKIQVLPKTEILVMIFWLPFESFVNDVYYLCCFWTKTALIHLSTNVI